MKRRFRYLEVIKEVVSIAESLTALFTIGAPIEEGVYAPI
jgi:hypothetical protein